jgi:hypothetical protein
VSGTDRSTRLRLFVTCWLVLTLHFATNFVREHYPALALAEHGRFSVGEYLGLHPDIFVAPSGKAYITNNPGVSILAAVPLFLFRPALDLTEAYGKRRLAESGGQVSAVYHTDSPNDRRFFREVRRRGLDLKLGLVTFLTVAFCMSPLTALAGVVMFDALRRLELARGSALFFAFLFVLGTPLFFRNGFLNQNQVLGLAAFFAFVLLWREPTLGGPGARRTLALAGFLGGFAVLCDYSGIVPLAFLGSYALLKSAARPARAANAAGELLPRDPTPREGGSRLATRRAAAARNLAWFAAGAALPLGFLLAYQWAAFGSPFRPAQSLMPPTVYSVRGFFGMTWPQPDLLWANLFDPRFGLFAFCPLLLLALPGFRLAPVAWFTRPEKVLIAAFAVLFLLFCSANQFARLTWNTGMRYTIPLVPFLFLLAVPVLRRLPPLLTYALAVLAFAQAWALAMVRESVPQSLLRVFVEGFQLPWLTVLGRTASQYAAFLEGRPSPLPLVALCGALVFVVWRFGTPARTNRAKPRRRVATGEPQGPPQDPVARPATGAPSSQGGGGA